MARPDVTIASTGGIATSIFPSGMPALASSGNIRYIGNPVHDSEVTIVSDGVIDFGQQSAFLIQAIKLDSSTAGTFLAINSDTMENGQQIDSCIYTVTNTTQLKIASVPSLPYGVGIQMGTHDVSGSQAWAKIETTSNVPYETVFKYEIGVYPAANQAAFVSLGGAGAQIKGSWELAGSNATNTSTDTDAYTSIFNPSNGTFQEAPLVTSNGGYIGSVVYHTAGQLTNILIDSTHVRTNPIIRESTLVFSKTDGSVHARIADTVDGTLCNYHTDVDLLASITNILPNIHHFPGNIQNISSDTGMGYFLSERIILGRSAARVEICDTPVPQTDRLAVTGITRKFAVCIPVAWSSNVIKVRLREQIFAGESLNGKYLHVYSDGTLLSPAGVFVGSVLINGEVLS